MQYQSIEDICLHDAIISKMIFNSNPDFLNTILLELTLYYQEKIEIHFLNCFAASTKLTMWIIGNDSIRTWSFSPTREQKIAIDNFVKKGFIQDRRMFQYISFDLNTTNSCISIIYEKAIISSETK